MTKIQKPQNITTWTVKFQVNWIYRNWDDKKNPEVDNCSTFIRLIV
jgi:hypothetical protein